jgi:putative transposase
MVFVKAGIGGRPVWSDLKSQCILGGEKFLEKIEPALKDKSLLREIPGCRRFISRPSLDELLSPHGIFDKRKRDELLKKAHLEYGYSFSEIGRHAGLHYATVSRIAREK